MIASVCAVSVFVAVWATIGVVWQRKTFRDDVPYWWGIPFIVACAYVLVTMVVLILKG